MEKQVLEVPGLERNRSEDIMEARISYSNSLKMSEQQLITFECIVCLNQYDKEAHIPILICQNQHNLCQSCVTKKMFKKQVQIEEPVDENEGGQQEEKYIYFCPLCNEKLCEDRFRRNNLLLEIYTWINELSKREKQKMQMIKAYQQELKDDKKDLETKVEVLKEENQNVMSLLRDLAKSDHSSLVKKQSQEFILKNEQSDLSEEPNTIDSMISQYEKIVTLLKAKKQNHRKEMQRKQYRKQKAQAFVFNFDLSHPDIGKFKIYPEKLLISMQGPFYRQFFQDYNFYYCVTSRLPIKRYPHSSDCTFRVKIVKTAKSRIYIGFASKDEVTKKNIHNYEGFVGIGCEKGNLKWQGKNFEPIQGKSCVTVKEGDVVTVEVSSQTISFSVNQEKIFRVQDGGALFKGFLYPVISMQIVNDEVQILQ